MTGPPSTVWRRGEPQSARCPAEQRPAARRPAADVLTAPRPRGLPPARPLHDGPSIRRHVDTRFVERVHPDRRAGDLHLGGRQRPPVGADAVPAGDQRPQRPDRRPTGPARRPEARPRPQRGQQRRDGRGQRRRRRPPSPESASPRTRRPPRRPRPGAADVAMPRLSPWTHGPHHPSARRRPSGLPGPRRLPQRAGGARAAARGRRPGRAVDGLPGGAVAGRRRRAGLHPHRLRRGALPPVQPAAPPPPGLPRLRADRRGGRPGGRAVGRPDRRRARLRRRQPHAGDLRHLRGLPDGRLRLRRSRRPSRRPARRPAAGTPRRCRAAA